MRRIGLALRERGLRLLLSAGLVSVTGDWVLRVGLSYSVYALTGSTLASAVMLLCSFVPQIVLGSVAGVFVDRWSPRRTMVAADLLLAAGLSPLLLVHRPGQIWIGYAVAAWEGCVQQFFDPAEQRERSPWCCCAMSATCRSRRPDPASPFQAEPDACRRARSPLGRHVAGEPQA